MQPAQARMVTVGEALPVLNHLPREVNRIHSLDARDEMSRNVAGPTASIENWPLLSVNESHQDVENFSGIGRAMAIGLYDATVLKWLRVCGRELLGLLNHPCQVPPTAFSYGH